MPSISRNEASGLGTRIQRVRASHSYGFVLLLILVSFLLVAFAPEDNLSQAGFVLVQTATLITAFWTSGLWQDRRPVLLLAAVGIVAVAGQIASGSDTATGIVGVVAGVLTVATCVVIGLGVVDQGQINRQSVLGAVSIYVLIGMLFMFAYGAAASFGSGTFFAQGTDGTPSIRLYFSYVTLATLGYGDYTAAGDLGRTLAITEAVLGQLYLVTVIAVLVANLGPTRRGQR
jgi:Ion channel